MSDIIRLLPDNIANQIAAGEVVQRPASVVKELIENAIDAGSSAIKVVIKDAGKTLIQVIDNGIGMSEVDARMSLEKHATSKIKTAEDLFNLHTMGFRGEALASIAAVAQLEMETCRKKEELGTRLVIEGAEFKSQTPVTTPQGTKISVKNLFFNIPARRNFLKSNPVETKHIIDEFQRAALARPDIAFSFYQNEQEVYQLPIAKLSHRIVHLLGDAYKKQLIPCQEATDTLKIHGYIGKPAQAKKTRGEQFFFINQRFIKSPYLHHAVTSAFEGLLPQGAFPFYVLFIEIDPQRIDVNVHPTKTEIKFDDERMVYAILTAAIKQALAVHHVTPSIDFEQNINFDPFGLATPSAASTSSPPPGGPSKFSEKNYAQFKHSGTAAPSKPQDWEALLKHLEKSSTQEAPATLQLASVPDTPAVAEETLKVQLHRKYLLTQVKSGVLLIDQQAAHERILYEQYLQPLEHSQSRSAQQLLFPVHIALNAADLALVQAHIQELQALGFVLENFGKDSLIVAGCPAEAADQDLKQLLEGLIEQFKWNQDKLSLTPQENLARSLAKRACIQPGQPLQKEEIDTLVDQLFACQNPNYTPDGRKTLIMLALEDIDKMLQA
ncbi:MAG: DNA mismatch repair endonuclease MutL [Bacteroidota bacterium]